MSSPTTSEIRAPVLYRNSSSRPVPQLPRLGPAGRVQQGQYRFSGIALGSRFAGAGGCTSREVSAGTSALGGRGTGASRGRRPPPGRPTRRPAAAARRPRTAAPPGIRLTCVAVILPGVGHAGGGQEADVPGQVATVGHHRVERHAALDGQMVEVAGQRRQPGRARPARVRRRAGRGPRPWSSRRERRWLGAAPRPRPAPGPGCGPAAAPRGAAPAPRSARGARPAARPTAIPLTMSPRNTASTASASGTRLDGEIGFLVGDLTLPTDVGQPAGEEDPDPLVHDPGRRHHVDEHLPAVRPAGPSSSASSRGAAASGVLARRRRAGPPAAPTADAGADAGTGATRTTRSWSSNATTATARSCRTTSRAATAPPGITTWSTRT